LFVVVVVVVFVDGGGGIFITGRLAKIELLSLGRTFAYVPSNPS
jgi:hypothetical protein